MAPIWVFLGGGTGAVLRWWVATLFPTPWATYGVNVAGSLLLAFLVHPSTGLDPAWRLALGTGMMGGLTTYSTYNFEVFEALGQGRWRVALAIWAGTTASALAGAAVGWGLAGLRGGA